MDIHIGNVNDQVRAMKIGCTFIKHHRYSCAKLRLIWVSDDLHQICWGETDGVKRKELGHLNVTDIKSVKRTSVNSKPLPLKEEHRKKNLMSLVTDKRTLELEATTEIIKEQWIHYLETLLALNGISSTHD